MKLNINGLHIHFIGIGGIGISALAQFCHFKGANCTGSEMQETAILKNLKNIGIKIYIPQKAENIPKNCNLIIYTEAIPEDNLELIEGKKRGIPMKSYFEFLGEISVHFHTIAVAGTHGKTTTTGALGAGFLHCDFKATMFVGSTLREFGNSNFYAGTNNFLLVEACEYRNSFGFLYPEIVILTNVELDHIDYYRDENHYLETFINFCKKAKTVIYHEKDKNARKVLAHFFGEKIMVTKRDILMVPNLKIIGMHNRENVALSIACAKKLDLDLEKFQNGLKLFQGAGRRQEFLGNIQGIQ